MCLTHRQLPDNLSRPAPFPARRALHARPPPCPVRRTLSAARTPAGPQYMGTAPGSTPGGGPPANMS